MKTNVRWRGCFRKSNLKGSDASEYKHKFTVVVVADAKQAEVTAFFYAQFRAQGIGADVEVACGNADDRVCLFEPFDVF